MFTHRTSYQSFWPRGFGELNPSHYSWIFTSISVDSSPRSYLFISATVHILVRIAPQGVTEPIRDVTLHFRDRRGEAQSVAGNAPKSSFVRVDRNLVWYGFRAGAWAIRYSVNTCPICDFTLKKAWRSIAALQKWRWNLRSYGWTEALSAMVFVPAPKLSGIVRTPIRYVTSL